MHYYARVIHCREFERLLKSGQKKLRPRTVPSFLEQFWIVGDKLPHTNGILVEILSNLPCIHSLPVHSLP